MTESTGADIARVTMLWPSAIKESVRQKVGARGLTEFVLEAVEAKLGSHDSHKDDRKELQEAKDLAQRLADALAMSGDYEDRLSTLRLMELPEWISTQGWPQQLEPSVPARRPVENVQLPAIGDPDTVLSRPPAKDRSDLLNRLQAKAAEKGVDLSGIDLSPASQIRPPVKVDPCPGCGVERVNGECWDCL